MAHRPKGRAAKLQGLRLSTRHGSQLPKHLRTESPFDHSRWPTVPRRVRASLVERGRSAARREPHIRSGASCQILRPTRHDTHYLSIPCARAVPGRGGDLRVRHAGSARGRCVRRDRGDPRRVVRGVPGGRRRNPVDARWRSRAPGDPERSALRGRRRGPRHRQGGGEPRGAHEEERIQGASPRPPQVGAARGADGRLRGEREENAPADQQGRAQDRGSRDDRAGPDGSLPHRRAATGRRRAGTDTSERDEPRFCRQRRGRAGRR